MVIVYLLLMISNIRYWMVELYGDTFKFCDRIDNVENYIFLAGGLFVAMLFIIGISELIKNKRKKKNRKFNKGAH